jgi:hypothetical protein
MLRQAELPIALHNYRMPCKLSGGIYTRIVNLKGKNSMETLFMINE